MRADGNVQIRNVNDDRVNRNVNHPDNDNRNLRVRLAAVVLVRLIYYVEVNYVL
jgi:hypothetical protein